MRYGISLGNSKLGRLAIGFLSDKGAGVGDVVAVVRSPAKAEDLAKQGVVVRRGEYGDEPSLVEAFQAARRQGSVFALAGISEPVARVLKLARLDQVFTILDGHGDA